MATETDAHVATDGQDGQTYKVGPQTLHLNSTIMKCGLGGQLWRVTDKGLFAIV